MKVKEFVEGMSKFPQDKELACQVAANDGKAWFVGFRVFESAQDENVVALSFEHPDIDTLPILTSKEVNPGIKGSKKTKLRSVKKK